MLSDSAIEIFHRLCRAILSLCQSCHFFNRVLFFARKLHGIWQSTMRKRRKSKVTEEDIRRGARIRAAREEKGWKQRELAKILGISQASVSLMESGLSKNPRDYPDAERALGLQPEYRKVLALPPPAPALAPPSPPAAIAPNFLIPPASDHAAAVPVLDVSSFPTGPAIMSEAAIAVIPGPSDLAQIHDRYAFYVFNEDMWPRYRPGELLVIHPRIPARTDDGVVLRNAKQEVLVREFVRSTPSEWIVRRYGEQGSSEETWPRAEWPMCHVIWEVRRG